MTGEKKKAEEGGKIFPIPGLVYNLRGGILTRSRHKGTEKMTPLYKTLFNVIAL